MMQDLAVEDYNYAMWWENLTTNQKKAVRKLIDEREFDELNNINDLNPDIVKYINKYLLHPAV